MDPLQYIAFYETDPIAMPGIVNLAHDWDLGLLVCARERGIRVLPDVSSVFFFRPFFDHNGNRGLGPLKLRVDFARAWKAFLELLLELESRGGLDGVFLGDELLWNGAHPDDIRRATSVIGASLPRHAGQPAPLIYLNEFPPVFSEGRNVFKLPVKPDAAGNPTTVTVTELGVTHISLDTYQSPQGVEAIYNSYLYPRMSPGQRAFIVPQAYASTYDPWESGRQAVAAAEGYLSWARRDPRIVGVNPWHWFSYEPFGCRGADGEGNPTHNTVGVQDVADLRTFWQNAAREIVQASVQRPPPPTPIALVHRFGAFADGETLPSTFSPDPAGRGGIGFDDPAAPAVGSVSFSRARGNRTSIMMKRSSSAFRYSWGSVPRVFEGIQWLSPRAAVQVIRFGLWLDSLTNVSLRLSMQFGGETVVRADLSAPEAQKQLNAGVWNKIEVRIDLNDRTYSVAVGGFVIIEAGIDLERNVTEVLFEGGPLFLSELELRTEPIPYARAYRSHCLATPPLRTVSLCDSRIGAVATTGEAFVKDLSLDGGLAFWTWMSGDVDKLVLEGERIGVLKKDGTVFVKEGPLDAPWTEESWNIAQLVLEGTRIGVLTKDGTVFVKEGLLDAPWTEESWNIAQLVLEGSRIGVLTKDGTVFVKEGPLDAPWTEESWNIAQLVLESSRIGVLTKDGTVFVKEGPLNAPWVEETWGTTTFALSGDGIIVLNQSGTAFLKRGRLNALWWQLNGLAL